MVNIPIKVEIGQKIHEWTVIRFDAANTKKGAYYICECKCSRQMSKPIGDLIRVGPKQCKSCATKARNFSKYGQPLKELKGQTFGKWKVLERVENDKNGGYWLCQCVCGTQKVVFGGELRRGKSKQCKSCGLKQGATKHGYGTRGNISSEYRCWAAIKTRCYNKNSKRYSEWGGRGIKVFPDWVESFEKFLEYMGDKPSKEYSIDRINNDGNYEPGNVRWASPKTQSNNRSNKKNRLTLIENP